MNNEAGDDYIRRTAEFIRANEQGLAAAGLVGRRRAPKQTASEASVFNPLTWFDSSSSGPLANVKPVVLAFDAHHLYYLLIRMEALGLDVGSLDVKVENPARPMNFVSIPGTDKSDTLSLRSFTSTFSAVSKLSLGAGWWGKPAPANVDAELKFVFSCFTRLPALRLHAPEPRMVQELANEAIDRAVPLYAFRSLQVLECADVDPRVIIGWDRLAESLKSLTLKRSGLEDVADIFVDAVLDDQARREGRATSPRSRRRRPPSRRGSFHRTKLPDSVPEDAEDSTSSDDSPTAEDTPKPDAAQLPSVKWASLRYLSLAENALTFLPSSPLLYLTSVVHLDLSSNLLVSVPSGLSALYSLVSLNLSDNMIDSVLGIYTMLGQVLTLNLSRNRLDSICGLERLRALERVDLRHNLIEESAEVGRLATLPNVAEVWVEGNPLAEIEEGYRIRCFDLFWKEGKTVLLDGSPPGLYEKRYLAAIPPEQMASARVTPTVAPSPPAVPVGSPSPKMKPLASSAEASPGLAPSQSASPQLAAVKGRRKKTRIVDFDGSEAGSSRSASHARGGSDATAVQFTASPSKLSIKLPHDGLASAKLVPSAPPKAVFFEDVASTSKQPSAAAAPLPPKKFVSRHTRRQTEFAPSLSSPPDKGILDAFDLSTSPPAGDKRATATRRSSTMSSRSATRRARVSASMYEPPTPGGEKDGHGQFSEAEAFRTRIEALRSDMGEGWLKVFNQSHMSSPPASGTVASS